MITLVERIFTPVLCIYCKMDSGHSYSDSIFGSNPAPTRVKAYTLNDTTDISYNIPRTTLALLTVMAHVS